MRRVFWAGLSALLFLSCVSASFLAFPNALELKRLLDPYVAKYGEYDDYIIWNYDRGGQLHVGFHWDDSGWYAVFYHFDGRWMVYEEGVVE